MDEGEKCVVCEEEFTDAIGDRHAAAECDYGHWTHEACMVTQDSFPICAVCDAACAGA